MHPTGLEHIMFCPKILVVEPSFKTVDNFLDNFFFQAKVLYHRSRAIKIGSRYRYQLPGNGQSFLPGVP